MFSDKCARIIFIKWVLEVWKQQMVVTVIKSLRLIYQWVSIKDKLNSLETRISSN